VSAAHPWPAEKLKQQNNVLHCSIMYVQVPAAESKTNKEKRGMYYYYSFLL